MYLMEVLPSDVSPTNGIVYGVKNTTIKITYLKALRLNAERSGAILLAPESAFIPLCLSSRPSSWYLKLVVLHQGDHRESLSPEVETRIEVRQGGIFSKASEALN